MYLVGEGGCCSIIFFMSRKYPWHDLGVWWLSPSPLLLGAGCGCVYGDGCMEVQMCPSLYAGHDENQNIKLNKIRSTLNFCL